MNIGIINYGMGNLFSVKSALDFIKCGSHIVNNPNELSNFSKLILPGVGSYNQAIKNLNEQGFKDYVLIMNLPHAKRILINDFAPTNPFPSAISINMLRNASNLKEFLN